MVVIPGSGNPEHIKESLDLFGFELTDDLPFIRNYSNCSAPQTRNAAHSSLWVLNSYKSVSLPAPIACSAEKLPA